MARRARGALRRSDRQMVWGSGHRCLQHIKLSGQGSGADYMTTTPQEDFAKSGKKYDIVLDGVAKRTFFSCKPSLAQRHYIPENPLKPKYHPFQFFSRLDWHRRARRSCATKR